MSLSFFMGLDEQVPEIEATIENEMNENKLGLVKERIRRRFFLETRHHLSFQ